MPDGLRYGTRFVPNPRVAWGARLIYAEVEAGGRGIVWDRTDAIGPDGERKLFLHYLNEVVGEAPFDGIRAAIAAGNLTPRSDDAVTVFDDDNVQVVVSAQGSHGYLYLTATAK